MLLLTGLRIGRSSGAALEKRGFLFRADSHHASLLPGDHRFAENQIQQTPGFNPTALRTVLTKLHESSKHEEEELVFHTVNGTPYNDSNLLHRYLKPAGQKLGIPGSTGTPCGGLTSRYSRRWEALCGTHRPNWVIPRCPPPSRSTPYRFPSSSAPRSRNSRF